MLKFDPVTLDTWKSRNIKIISLEFIESGCEGTTIQVNEAIMLPNYELITSIDSMIDIYALSAYRQTLVDAYITRTGNKWILTSTQVLTRCNCGKSFSITTGDSKLDKIQLLRSKLAKKRSTHH